MSHLHPVTKLRPMLASEKAHTGGKKLPDTFACTESKDDRGKCDITNIPR